MFFLEWIVYNGFPVIARGKYTNKSLSVFLNVHCMYSDTCFSGTEIAAKKQPDNDTSESSHPSPRRCSQSAILHALLTRSISAEICIFSLLFFFLFFFFFLLSSNIYANLQQSPSQTRRVSEACYLSPMRKPDAKYGSPRMRLGGIKERCIHMLFSPWY